MAHEQLSHLFRVKPGDKVRLRDWDPAWAGTKHMRKLRGDQLKREAEEIIKRNLERIADAQELLWPAYKNALLVLRVHPEFLEKQKLPAKPGRAFWEERYEDINCFERHLERNRTVILKFFLHISKREQKRRLLQRLDNPKKQWKFSPADLAERA